MQAPSELSSVDALVDADEALAMPRVAVAEAKAAPEPARAAPAAPAAILKPSVVPKKPRPAVALERVAGRGQAATVAAVKDDDWAEF